MIKVVRCACTRLIVALKEVCKLCTTCRIFLIFISNPPPPPVPGSDYTGVTEFMLFSPSDTRECVNIAIETDDFVENDETFTVELSEDSDSVILGVSMATVTILDMNSKFTTSL